MYIQYYTRNDDGLQMDVQYVQGMNKSVLVAMPMTGEEVVQLMPERDGAEHHWLEASARNLTMKRATYKCTIITITISTPWQKRLTSSKSHFLHNLHQCVWYGRVCPFYGVVGTTLSLSPLSTNAIDGALPKLKRKYAPFCRWKWMVLEEVD